MLFTVSRLFSGFLRKFCVGAQLDAPAHCGHGGCCCCCGGGGEYDQVKGQTIQNSSPDQEKRARGKASAQELKLKIARCLLRYFMHCISAPRPSRLRDLLDAYGARGEPTAPRRAAQAPDGRAPPRRRPTTRQEPRPFAC